MREFVGEHYLPGTAAQDAGRCAKAARAAADQLRRVRYHAGGDGSLSEEFNRETGMMESASNLTWSYAALLSAAKIFVNP